MTNPDPAPNESARLQELIAQRRAKAAALHARGGDPYPPRTRGRITPIAQARAVLEAWESGRRKRQPRARVAGRITALRNLGKLAFIDLRDGSGSLQLLCRSEMLKRDWPLLTETLDLGDFVEAQGSLLRTHTGEISVEAKSLRLLSKALRPPPEKFHGLHDVELRYRQRYLDLQSNDTSRDVFIQRSHVITALRQFMDKRGFLEVETPVLQVEAGGAAARPFQTHLNALDEPRYLRIATELHLKRLIVGGLDKVYEVGRIFRNEGVSTLHNPEFTLMESYEAYADYGAVAEMVEKLVPALAKAVLGTTQVRFGDHTIDLSPPWKRITMRQALIDFAGIDFQEYRSVETMTQLLRDRHIPVPKVADRRSESNAPAPTSAGWGKLLDALISELVEPRLIQPTFLLDYPVELSPLAKRKVDDPSLVERFEAFMVGWEIANAYSELNDPDDQRARFQEQLRLRAAGDEEAELMDEDFLVALEHGMPPTGGLGVGIDRLMMVLTDSPSIRDVILFPQLRKKD